jgi:hypothetical protein
MMNDNNGRAQEKIALDEQAGAPLDQLLAYIERAVRGDRRLRVQLFREMQRLAHHPSAPLEERCLGEVLSRVLMGDRQPDLSGLPEDMAVEVQTTLDKLKR